MSKVTRSRVFVSGWLIAVILLATVQHVAFPGAVAPPERNAVAARGDDVGPRFLGPLYDAIVLQEYRAHKDEGLADVIRRLEVTGFGDALPSIVNRVVATAVSRSSSR